MFFKDTSELQKYVDINGSFEFELINPKLKQVDRDVLNHHFGSLFIEEIQADYDSVAGVITTLPIHQQKLIDKFRSITAPYSIALHITSGQLQIDSAGIFVAKNENRGVPWEWQIKELRKSYLKPAYQAIEDTILFLRANISDFTTYANSDEYEYYNSSFISSSKEFTRLYTPLNNSFQSFLSMRSCMDKSEENDIKNIILPDYYSNLKTKIKTNSLTIADKAIMPFIKKAIANLTALRAISELNASFDENGFMIFDNTVSSKVGASKKTAAGEIIIRAQESLSVSAKSDLENLAKYLEENKVSYPIYTSDSKYKLNQNSTFTNTPGSGFYAAL